MLALGTLSLALTTSATPVGLETRQQQSRIAFAPCPDVNEEIASLTGSQGLSFECATLAVPLDYTRNDSTTIDLQLFQIAATQEPVLGTVLINFGGPGGTGAENLPIWGDQAHKTIGAQWNLLSWDPRGTGNTIPFICNTTAPGAGATTPLSKRDEELVLASANLTDVFLRGGWEVMGAVATTCAEQVDSSAELIGSAFSARDMMQIVDALGEDGLLRYYGWSYGTALGSYAAAMFPERIERMVLDGNVNPQDYAAGHYGKFLDKTDESLAAFVQACFDVKDDCGLYAKLQPESVQDIYDTVNKVLAPMALNVTSSPETFAMYAGIKTTLLEPLYFPHTWASFGNTVAKLLDMTEAPPAAAATPAPASYGTAQNALIGIRASDATFIANSSDEYLARAQYQSTVSPGFSDVLYTALWTSAQWKIPAKERYWGDFRTTTKNPILYINGETDPVTPLVNAQDASQLFADSAVLAHTGQGHGIFVHPSRCVHERVNAYFRDGSLPANDTVCQPDESITELWTRFAQRLANNQTFDFTALNAPDDSNNSSSSDNGSGNGNGNGNSNSNGNVDDANANAGTATRSSLCMALLAALLALAYI